MPMVKRMRALSYKYTALCSNRSHYHGKGEKKFRNSPELTKAGQPLPAFAKDMPRCLRAMPQARSNLPGVLIDVGVERIASSMVLPTSWSSSWQGPCHSSWFCSVEASLQSSPSPCPKPGSQKPEAPKTTNPLTQVLENEALRPPWRCARASWDRRVAEASSRAMGQWLF